MLGSVRTLAYSDHSLKQINAHSSPQLMDCILMHTLEVHHRRHFLLSASFGMVSPLEKKTARTATLTSRRSLNDIKPHAQAVLRPGLVPPAGPESAQMCSPQISGMDSKKKKQPVRALRTDALRISLPPVFLCSDTSRRAKKTRKICILLLDQHTSKITDSLAATRTVRSVSRSCFLLKV